MVYNVHHTIAGGLVRFDDAGHLWAGVSGTLLINIPTGTRTRCQAGLAVPHHQFTFADQVVRGQLVSREGVVFQNVH